MLTRLRIDAAEPRSDATVLHSGGAMHDGIRWTREDLERFLLIRQEFFLDPMGSNKDRFLDAANALQRALFDWYLSPPGTFRRMLDIVSSMAESWATLRQRRAPNAVR